MKYTFLAITFFADLTYTEEKINGLETVASILFCSLERSNNPYIKPKERRERSSLCGFDLKQNPRKGLR